MFESIHEPRHLSLKHWRLRTVNWFFGAEQGVMSDDVPAYFYKHYCPTFHFTNLVVLFVPLVIVAKVVIFCLVRGLFPLIEAIGSALKKGKSGSSEKEKVEPINLVELIQGVWNWEDEGFTFETFWDRRGFIMLKENDDKEYWRERYEAIVVKREAAKLRAEEKKRKMQARLTFWINFSSVFVKWVLYVVYAGLIAGSGYMAINFGGGALSWFWGMLFGTDWINVLMYSGGFIACVTALATFVWAAEKYSWLGKTVDFIGDAIGAVTRPILLPILSAIMALLGGLAVCFETSVEFVEMFFAENCPEIIIVSDEDEQIEESV